MPRRAHIVTLAAFSLCCVSCGGAPSGPGRVERVILVVCDTLRADRLGVYGYERDTSPALDAFAREAVVFDEAYASAPMTVPAMASVMTGRFPSEVGVTPGNFRLIPPQVETLAERLVGEGITTAAVISNPVLSNRGMADDVGFEQGFEHVDTKMTQRERIRKAMWERPAPDTTDAAIEWLEAEKRRGNDRFFLWVHYQDPHGPYTPPPEFERRFARPDPDPLRVRIGPDKLGRGDIPHYQNIDGEQRVSVYRDLYDAEVAYFDHHFGRFVKWLRDNNLYQGSLIVFTADHGEALGEHDYWFCHGENVYRDVVRVPFIVRYPRSVTEPTATTDTGGYRRVDSLVGHVDVRPTIEAAFGLAPASLRGQPLIGGDVPAGRVLPQRLLPGDDRTQWEALSDGRYRLLWNEEDQNYRLFDVQQDPGEAVDLAPGNPRRVERMLAAANTYLEKTRQGSVEQAPVRDMTPEMQDMMQGLGYTEAGTSDDERAPRAQAQGETRSSSDNGD